MVDLIEDLKSQFPVQNLEFFGEVVVIPRSAFRHGWEKELESQGHRVFSNTYDGEPSFFVRLMKGKTKEILQPQVTVQDKPGSLKPIAERDLNGKFVRIPLTLLESSDEAPREVYEDIESLAATIRMHGLLEPLLVTPRKDKNGYEIVAGERRLRACRKAGLSVVPCLIVEGLTVEQFKELQLIENVQRRNLTPFEEIKLISALYKRGLSEKDIAAACGLSYGTVSNYVTIDKAVPIELQRTIERDTHDPYALTVQKALVLARSKLEPHQLEAKVSMVKSEGASVKDLAKRIAKEVPTKLQRARQTRIYWLELLKSLKNYAVYWSEFATLKEWEDVDAYHAELTVKLPKDLKELETSVHAN